MLAAGAGAAAQALGRRGLAAGAASSRRMRIGIVAVSPSSSSTCGCGSRGYAVAAVTAAQRQRGPGLAVVVVPLSHPVLGVVCQRRLSSSPPPPPPPPPPPAGAGEGEASSKAKEQEQQQQQQQQVEQREVLIYTGGHADVIRTLKRVSLTTCVIGLFSTPFFLALGSEAVPMAANAALTGVVLLATCGPTVLLHAFTKPYILALRQVVEAGGGDNDAKAAKASDPLFRAETIDFLTRRLTTEFRLSDVKPLPNSTRPFTSFAGREGRLYFVHGETFADKGLLQKLLGRPLKKQELEPVAPPSPEQD